MYHYHRPVKRLTVSRYRRLPRRPRRPLPKLDSSPVSFAQDTSPKATNTASNDEISSEISNQNLILTNNLGVPSILLTHVSTDKMTLGNKTIYMTYRKSIPTKVVTRWKSLNPSWIPSVQRWQAS